MSSEAADPIPTIRILHHMARSGGTVICRCLGAMKKIVLLSEIHPLGVRMYNPLDQADQWYKLFSEEDARQLSARPPSFEEAIALIELRCREKGLHLLLRDWSHLDYTGVPFVKPGYSSLLAGALESRFALLRYSTVRHPLDQWLSLTKNPLFKKSLSARDFLKGAKEFANAAAKTGFSRYEDFTAGHDQVLQRICRDLSLPYDPAYTESWQTYENITGDVLPGRAGQEIQTLPRQHMDSSELEAFESEPDFREILDTLGYS